jgi:ribosomal protein S18 acetylase RimI-like enzyme
MILKPEEKTDSLFSVIHSTEVQSFPRVNDDILRTHFREDDVFITRQWQGSIVGHCIVEPRTLSPYIFSIAIRPEFRGKGWGSGLLTQVAAHYRSLKKINVDLHVQVDNTRAIILYLKHGYRVKSLVRDYYGGDGDGILMRKLLSQEEL